MIGRRHETAPSVVAVASSRGAGATSVALGIAAILSEVDETLLLDLNPDGADVAPLLDMDDRKNVYHLAYLSRLARPTPHDIEELVQRHERLAVLPGVTDPAHGGMLDAQFVVDLLSAAQHDFSHVVLDVGRMRTELPGMDAVTAVLWVIRPTPAGLLHFDRDFRRLARVKVPWLDRVRVVVNQMAPHSLVGVGRLLHHEHVRSAGTIPYEPDLWRAVELGGALRELIGVDPNVFSPARDVRDRAPRTRRAFEALLKRISVDNGASLEERRGRAAS